MMPARTDSDNVVHAATTTANSESSGGAWVALGSRGDVKRRLLSSPGGDRDYHAVRGNSIVIGVGRGRGRMDDVV